MAGQTRFRKLQFGKQTVIGTAVAATRVVPYRGLIVYNPNRVEPDVDTGSLDDTIAPFNQGNAVTLTATGPQWFNDLPLRLSAGVKGGVTAVGPTGITAYTWTFQAASLTADPFEYYSIQSGDDTSDASGAGTNGYGGVIDNFSMDMPQDLGPWTVSDDWVLASAVYGNRTAALTVDANPIPMFGADTEFYLNSTPATIGTTKLVDSVRGASLKITNNLDQKRFANGSNTRFALAGYGRGPRQIVLTLTVEKTAAAIAEAITLASDPVPSRYIEIRTTSPSLAGTALPYSAKFFLPVRLFDVSDGEIGGNANYTFTYHGFYDTTLTYAFKSIVVNTQATLP
jgi:hypothetical protein